MQALVLSVLATNTVATVLFRRLILLLVYVHQITYVLAGQVIQSGHAQTLHNAQQATSAPKT